MLDFFLYIDRLLFSFLNRTLANPLFDIVMPFLTDLNKYTISLILAGLVWLALMIWGGQTGRIVGVGLILVITLSDQLNSSILKGIFERPRPCHFVDGIFNIEDVRLLVGCGGGRSFPSSHAANNAAVATFLSWFYPRYKWYFILFALTIGFSRVYVGVHFPSDVLAGFGIGVLCGFVVIGIMTALQWGLHRFHKRRG